MNASPGPIGLSPCEKAESDFVVLCYISNERGYERAENSLNFGPAYALLWDMSDAMLELDGSFGEGGGQILRTSLALSLLTGRAFHLYNVRAGRKKPGLQPQHLMSVRAAA